MFISLIRQSRVAEVTGVRLWFENGKVVKASAEKNEDYLLKMLDTDAGSRTLGEFAIGTSPNINRFTGEILFDEKLTAVSIWRWVPVIRKAAARTNRRYTGI